MTVYEYKTIVSKAKAVKTNVEKNYKIGVSNEWGYYFSKAVSQPNKSVTRINIKSASKPSGDYISNQIYKKDYLDVASRIAKYVEKNHQMPNYVTWGKKKIRVRDYIYMLARIIVYYDKNKEYPKYANINTKCWTKPSESTNEVYNYFIKVFGSFGDTIDGALAKIGGRGYGYYYDDTYSNKQSIDRMKNKQGINCTDSMQVFYNIMLELIKKGKYKKVECLHVRCSDGDGHVRMRVTKNDGSTFLRDPACTLKSGGTCNWCTENYTLLAINPSWFMQNLNR